MKSFLTITLFAFALMGTGCPIGKKDDVPPPATTTTNPTPTPSPETKPATVAIEEVAKPATNQAQKITCPQGQVSCDGKTCITPKPGQGSCNPPEVVSKKAGASGGIGVTNTGQPPTNKSPGIFCTTLNRVISRDERCPHPLDLREAASPGRTTVTQEGYASGQNTSSYSSPNDCDGVPQPSCPSGSTAVCNERLGWRCQENAKKNDDMKEVKKIWDGTKWVADKIATPFKRN